MGVQISLTKNTKRKKKIQIHGIINRRKPILNLTVQLVMYLYTKKEFSVLNRYIFPTNFTHIKIAHKKNPYH